MAPSPQASLPHINTFRDIRPSAFLFQYRYAAIGAYHRAHTAAGALPTGKKCRFYAFDINRLRDLYKAVRAVHDTEVTTFTPVFIYLKTAASEETITVTTYYPSPYGSYNQLNTNYLQYGLISSPPAAGSSCGASRLRFNLEHRLNRVAQIE